MSVRSPLKADVLNAVEAEDSWLSRTEARDVGAVAAEGGRGAIVRAGLLRTR